MIHVEFTNTTAGRVVDPQIVSRDESARTFYDAPVLDAIVKWKLPKPTKSCRHTVGFTFRFDEGFGESIVAPFGR
jgi:hypothetical protein